MAGEPKSSQPGGQKAPSAEEKDLSADWLRQIESALKRDAIKLAFERWKKNRKLLRGIDPDRGDARMRTNLHFANLATMRPQIYAKDPEYDVVPTSSVPEQGLPAVQKFAEAAEEVITTLLVKRASLKRRMKRLVTGAYTVSIGWLMCAWQEPPRDTQPVIQNVIKDESDNQARLEIQQQDAANPQPGQNPDLVKAKAEQTAAGINEQSEIPVGRGITLDFVNPEDLIPLDPSIQEIGDYLRSRALALRVWMTKEQYRETFGKDASQKAKVYVEVSTGGKAQQAGTDKNAELLCVWQIWDQTSNRVFTVCDGEEGFCRDPFTPDWTGKRWYPFFGLAFNEIDGTLYPISDIELTDELVREYNKSRDDLEKDRQDARPLTLFRKGGTLTPEDVERIRNRDGNDIIGLEGTGNQPIQHDIVALSFGDIKPDVYNTQPARADIEQIIGGGDAARGSVMEAKTATEAEILSQGLRSRSAERQDSIEDLLTDLGSFVLQIALRKLTAEEVQRIVGPDLAQSWPTLNVEQIFEQVAVEVKSGSTGKPDRLQEQDRWTKLLPVIEKTIEQVAQLNTNGQVQLAQALTALLRETLRRFDERLDLDQFLPPPSADGQMNPAMLAQQNAMLKQQLEQMQHALQEATAKVEKGIVAAAATIATSANPGLAVMTVPGAMNALQGLPPPPGTPGPGVADPAGISPDDPAIEAHRINAETAANERLGMFKAQVQGQTQENIAKTKAQADVAIAHHQTDAQRMAQDAAQMATAPLQAHLQTLAQHMSLMTQQGAAAAQKPKTKKRVVHQRNPETGNLESHLIEEPADQPQQPAAPAAQPQ